MPRSSANTAEMMLLPRDYKNRASEPNPQTPVHILLAEDNASDVWLTEIALDDAELDYELHTLKNGVEVVPYLRHLLKLKYYGGRLPDLLILDLSLPRMDGFEILSELSELAKQSECFSELPIVILTGDTNSTFLRKCYSLNIISYLVKPCTGEKIHEVMRRIRRK